jgi:hypothetical protein
MYTMSEYSVRARETATVDDIPKISFDVYRDLSDGSGVQRVGGGWYAITGRTERVSDHELIQHYLSLSKQR